MLFPTLLAASLLIRATAQDVSSSQYWHERYHGILSMAAYGDYNTECPKFFTAAALAKSFPDRAVAPWQLLSAWGPTESGLEGFNVVIPEMDKVVMVFKGLYGWENLNMTAAPLTNLYIDGCENCTAHAGALKAYEEAKVATNDWEIVKIYINSTGYQWSITGHGFGGMVAQVASLDLGWRGLSHWTHNHGSPRVFNKAAADLFNSLYQGEASQRTVANEDSVPTTIPESDDYTFTLQGMHIYGTNTTYGMNFDICATSPTDPNCLGGSNRADHEFYYTPIGKCAGSFVAYDSVDQVAFASSQSAAYNATAVVATPFNSATLATLASTATPEPTTTEAPTTTLGSTTAAALAATTAVTGEMLLLALVVAGACAITTAQDVTSSQFWHERYHGLLSMSAYGDFEAECPRTFTRAALLQSFPESTSEPFTVLSKWGPTESGLEGFNVVVPEMDKVVMVFKGMFGWENLDMTAVPVDEFYIEGCENCTAHSGAYNAYLEARELTDDWAEVKAYVNSTGHQWSITGHGFGGMVAQVASLDLGWRGLCHWTHNHGSPRVFNKAAADLYNRLYQGEAGQRTVANEDLVPTIIPESDDYTFTLQGFHVYGTNATYGQNFDVCAESATDPRCLGGNVAIDHGYYYTPIGFCGHPNYLANLTHQASVLSLGASAYAVTATGTAVFNASTPASTVSATPTSTVEAPVTISAPAQTTTAPAGATQTVIGGAGRVGAGGLGVVMMGIMMLV